MALLYKESLQCTEQAAKVHKKRSPFSSKVFITDESSQCVKFKYKLYSV